MTKTGKEKYRARQAWWSHLKDVLKPKDFDETMYWIKKEEKEKIARNLKNKS